MIEEKESASIPLFGNAVRIKTHYGLSLPRLTELVSAGAVKTIKFGSSKQSGRLYSTRDVERALEKMALGRTVIRKDFKQVASDESQKI